MKKKAGLPHLLRLLFWDYRFSDLTGSRTRPDHRAYSGNRGLGNCFVDSEWYEKSSKPVQR